MLLELWATGPADHELPADGRERDVCRLRALVLPLLPLPLHVWHGSVGSRAQQLLTQ